jgi:D-serine deaminase-like pyridoxal phosphate-dependent protein
VLSLAEIETPAVLVDLDVCERNLMDMAARARRAGVRLRPHAKTHKCPELGTRQLALGAVGLALAKVSEAEVFAAHGCTDIFLPYPIVGADKARRLLALGARARVAVGVDSLTGAASLAGVFAAAGKRLPVHLKVDTGYHRVGVAPAAALGLARQVAALPGLELCGVFSHSGHAYLAESPAQVAAIAQTEVDTLGAVAAALRADGLAIEHVSVGSTPALHHAPHAAQVNEWRPGNYLFHDASQVSLGTCTLADCALTVLATVVSVPRRDQAVLDAGSKTLSSDPLRPAGHGFGWLLGYRSRVRALSEEHGIVALEADERLEVGQRVRLLPNHACVVANLHAHLYGLRGEQLERRLHVAARGCVT